LATNGGNEDATYSLEMELRNKKGKEAFSLFKESANKGHIKAVVELG